MTAADRESFEGLGAVGFAAASIRQGDAGMIYAAGAVCRQPRAWTPFEIALLEDATERTWAALTRANAERRLAESEARLQQFAAASAGGLWIRDSSTLKMGFVRPAVAAI